MRKIILLILISAVGFSQGDKRWKGYYSYSKITDITQSPDNIIASSTNALFFQNIKKEKTTTLSTIDGLSGGDISTIYYSKEHAATLIGYVNGLIQIIKSGKSYTISDIQIKTGITPSRKKINHFLEHNSKIYISTDFGISVYDMTNMRFVDTYFIGNSGNELSVNQTAILDETIYAATFTEGLKSCNINNPSIIDYTQWSNAIGNSWRSIGVFNNKLLGVTADNQTIYFVRDQFNEFVSKNQQPANVVDVTLNEKYIVLTNTYSVTVYDVDFSVVNIFYSSDNYVFTSALIKNDQVYIGTEKNGLLKASLNNNTAYQNITPDGPTRNAIFSLRSTPSKLWVVYGDYDDGFNPYPLDEYEINAFTYRKGWESIPYSGLLESKSIVRVFADPLDENHVYFSSYFSGLLELDKNGFKLNNSTNSGLESVSTAYEEVRTNGVAFDSKRNLWVTNSQVENGLKSLQPNGEWKSYSMAQVFDKSATQNDLSKIVVDKNDTKWFATNLSGVIAFNEKESLTPKKITSGSETGNLPIQDVRAIAIDQNNILWIGTTLGLRIINVDQFKKETNLTAQSIIILDDGLAQELLFEQSITDIVVDGSNKKWVSTAGSGLFYLSENGQETYFHFTTENSPLPSNVIMDIDVNKDTGELFIATDKGLVSFQTNVTGSNTTLENVLVYPNPVRPNYQGMVTIKGLKDASNVKITDVTGNLVYQQTAEGGSVQWNQTAFNTYKVASGVYLVFVVDEEGVETQVRKIMIIR